MRLIVVEQTTTTWEEGKEKLFSFGDMARWLNMPRFALWSRRKMFSAELELCQDNWEMDWRQRGS